MIERFENFDLEKELAVRNRKARGFIPVALKADGSEVMIPIVMVIGKEEGPLVVSEGCAHGDEVEGAEGIVAAYEALDPEKMKGSFVGVPVLNTEAFVRSNRAGERDMVGQDMNRIFPGDPAGTLSHRVARFYFDNFVRKADGLISMHGGGRNLALMPVALYQNYGDGISARSKEMAYAMGFDSVWQNNYCNGPDGILDENAYLAGVPAITAEIGGQVSRLKYRESDPGRIAKGIINVLRVFGIIDEPVEKHDIAIDIEMSYITNKTGGLHHPIKKVGETVKEGEVVSTITDIFGNELEQIKSPFDGYVMGVWVTPVVDPFGWVYMLGKPVK
ncbi:MAG: succinylglutamate desuccinylase/aspartoacylase family protein [Firmicutes bacterium]|nr:succinylglutamate desuccinylase/aspartoacylase family protein [Bacillota bacterium]